MFIPLTHDRAWVYRLPIVSLAVMALCLLAFLATDQSSFRKESDRLLEEAVGLFISYSDLEPDPRLLSPAVRERIEDLLDRAVVEGGLERPRGGPKRQRQLDELTASWLASIDENPLWQHGLVPARGWSGLATHMFLHVGWLHLIGNLFFLYLTGPLLEDSWGRARFAAFYIVGGLFAGLFFAARYSELYRPLVGASGAVSAVLGAFLVYFGASRIRFLVWVGVPLGTFHAPAALMLPLWFASEAASALFQDAAAPGGAGGVAYWAHVAGFAFGVVVAAVMRAVGVRSRDEAATPAAGKDLAKAAAALARGDQGLGLKLHAELALRQANDPEAVLPYWDAARSAGRAGEAAPLVLGLVRQAMRGGAAETAVQWWSEVRSAVPTRRVDPELEVELASELRRLEVEPEMRQELLLAAVDHLSFASPPALVARIQREARLLSGLGGSLVADRLSARDDLPPALLAPASTPA